MTDFFYDHIDVFRWAVMAEGMFLIGFVLAVLVEARRFAAIPRHVIWASLSYMILVAGAIIEIHARLGNDPTWRTLFALSSFTFGVYTMWSMWKAYNYTARVARHKDISTRTAHRLLEDRAHARKTNGD